MENSSNPNPNSNNNNLFGNQNSYSNNNISNNKSNSQDDSQNNNFSNNSPTDNQNTFPENSRQDNDNNWPRNYPSNNNSEYNPPRCNPIRRKNNFKHSKDTTPSEDTTNHRILLPFKKDEYRIFEIDLHSYQKGENENGFILFSREYHFSWSEKSDDLSNQMSKIRSFSSCNYSLSSQTISLDNSCEGEIDSRLRLCKVQHIYLAHFYKEIPTNFNSELFRSQIDCYKVNQNFTLAHFNGFSFDDYEDNPIPTVLTDRPVNGPLSSLFKKVKSNNEPNIYTFNLSKLDSITAEQKFALICGIVNGIGFIHKNGFIHSNLSPKTIYIDRSM